MAADGRVWWIGRQLVELVRLAFTLLVGAAILAVALGARNGAAAASADARLKIASEIVATAIGPSGPGLGFFAVQRNREYARPGGPKINVVDPADPRRVIGETDELEVNAMMAKGVIRPDGFFMAMRLGPAPGAGADFERAPQIFQALETTKGLWRDDGAGWYATDSPPGMGIDPASARLLPRALANLRDVTLVGTDLVGGIAVTGYAGTLTVADYPGAVAADGAPFTEPTFRFEAWLDALNRPLMVVIRARNLNQDIYDLVAETVITFDYAPAAALPEPVPTMAPEALDGVQAASGT